MKRILTLMLQGPQWEEQSALKVAAEFTYMAWLEVSEQEEKVRLVDFVTEALISGRDAVRVKTLFKDELSTRFIYLRRALPLIHARIDDFMVRE